MFKETAMDAHVKEVVRACTKASDAGSVTFGEVVARLIEAGVERYHADLVRSEKTYYLAGGASETVPNSPIDAMPAQAFSAEGVEATVRSIQAGLINYKTFCERVMTAGCVGYLVSMVGRRVVYYGRSGDSHVEHFPRARV
jgi:uncharacterized protein YbcV (DUF1398 family)